MKQLLLGIAIIIQVTACVNKEKEAIRLVNERFIHAASLLSIERNDNANIYIVIPRAGCGGCISDAENFMKKTLESTDEYASRVKFILTDFGSEKTLKARLGNLFNDKRVVLDKKGVFQGDKILRSIYPVIFFLDKDKNVHEVSSFSPEESGLTAIENYVSESETAD